MGTQLLVRGPQGVQLTSPGKAFLDQARLALEFADRAMASARLAERGKNGLLRVDTLVLGIPPVGETVLREFADRFVDVEVELHHLVHRVRGRLGGHPVVSLRAGVLGRRARGRPAAGEPD